MMGREIVPSPHWAIINDKVQLQEVRQCTSSNRYQCSRSQPELSISTADFTLELNQPNNVRVDHIHRENAANLTLRSSIRQLI